MGYKAIYPFLDKTDNQFYYAPGDKFPRDGVSVSKDRIEYLLSDTNVLKRPLIEKVEEKANDDKRIAKDNHRRTRNRTE